MPAERRRFLADNLVAGAGTFAAGLLGFAFQSITSHHLHPVEYGAAFAVLTFGTFATFPSGAFSRLLARSTSRSLAGDGAAAAALAASANRRLLAGGAGLGLVCLAAAPAVAGFLQVPVDYIWAAALGIPFQMATPALLGRLQGGHRFRDWSILSVALAASKLAFALLLARWFGAAGVILGVSVASGVAYGLGYGMTRPAVRGGAAADWDGASRYLLLVAASSVTLAVLTSVDVLVVKHLFSPRVAGEYAATAAIGRSLFWATGGISSVAFARTASHSVRGSGVGPTVAGSIALAVAGGLVGAGLFAVGARPILLIFAGANYLDGAGYLAWYGLGMVLLGAASVLVSAQQSLARPAVLLVLLPATVLKPLLLFMFHADPLQVVLVGDALAAVLLLVLAVQFVVGLAPAAVLEPAAAPVPAE